jgi:hypothetical protein
LEHVDALLKLRGVDPESLHIPEKRHWRYRRAGQSRLTYGVAKPLRMLRK